MLTVDMGTTSTGACARHSPRASHLTHGSSGVDGSWKPREKSENSPGAPHASPSSELALLCLVPGEINFPAANSTQPKGTSSEEPQSFSRAEASHYSFENFGAKPSESCLRDQTDSDTADPPPSPPTPGYHLRPPSSDNSSGGICGYTTGRPPTCQERLPADSPMKAPLLEPAIVPAVPSIAEKAALPFPEKPLESTGDIGGIKGYTTGRPPTQVAGYSRLDQVPQGADPPPGAQLLQMAPRLPSKGGGESDMEADASFVAPAAVSDGVEGLPQCDSGLSSLGAHPGGAASAPASLQSSPTLGSMSSGMPSTAPRPGTAMLPRALFPSSVSLPAPRSTPSLSKGAGRLNEPLSPLGTACLGDPSTLPDLLPQPYEVLPSAPNPLHLPSPLHLTSTPGIAPASDAVHCGQRYSSNPCNSTRSRRPCALADVSNCPTVGTRATGIADVSNSNPHGVVGAREECGEAVPAMSTSAHRSPAPSLCRLSLRHGASRTAVAAYVNRLAEQLLQQVAGGQREAEEAGPTHGALGAGTGTVALRDNYQVLKQIGRGHFGAVSLCEERGTGQRFACKTILKGSIKRKEDVEELCAEILAMLRLQSPPAGSVAAGGSQENLVHLHEVVEDGDAVHLVMDYCEGGDLFEQIEKSKGLSEKEAAGVLRQLIMAVHHIHSHQLIHRDIKPENILLKKLRPTGLSASHQGRGQPMEIKLADFGLCVEVRKGQRACGAAGSPFYMAPEVVARQPYGREVDVWSMGVVLYTCLGGHLPFWGADKAAVFAAVLRAKPNFQRRPWPAVSGAAKSLIQWMLQADPAQRPKLQEVLGHPWMQHHCPGAAQQLALLQARLAMRGPRQSQLRPGAQAPAASGDAAPATRTCVHSAGLGVPPVQSSSQGIALKSVTPGLRVAPSRGDKRKSGSISSPPADGASMPTSGWSLVSSPPGLVDSAC